MPNKHAALKDLRKSRKHAAKNARMKTHLRALTKQLHELIRGGKKSEALILSQKLQQTFAKAAKSHVIHRNKASRKISWTHSTLAKVK